MPTSPYFNNFGNSGEQALFEDLIIENIKIHGMDFLYLPRRFGNYDKIYEQDDISYYDTSYLIEMYILNYDGFSGEGNIFSKFGLEIRDQITFTVARKSFQNYVSKNESAILRPRDGDLVYYPLNKKLFEIDYVEDKPFHYPLGILPTYNLNCSLFEYSSQRFDTGIEEIDRIQKNYSADVDHGGNIANNNPLADNDVIQQEANTYINWDEVDVWSEGKV